MKRPFLLGPFLFFLICLAWRPLFLQAQEADPGLIRALNTDSASVENAYYLWATVDNDSSPYHWLYLYGEGVFGLNKDWGIELDFPTLEDIDPLGTYPLGLGPVGLNLRYEAYRFGSWNSETAGVISFQAGGAYGPPNRTYRYIGSSWTLKVLAGYRVGKLFAQGNYAFQGGIDPQSLSMASANTSLGYGLGSNWYIQAEGNFYAVTAPFHDSSWTFVPQLAFQPGDWLFEFGEAFNDDNPTGTTEILAARTF